MTEYGIWDERQGVFIASQISSPEQAARKLDYWQFEYRADEEDPGVLSIRDVPDEIGEPFDVVAEMQRQLAITIAAEEAAKARGERVPASGMPGFEEWKRRALRAAGETYTIIRGERVPLS